MQKSSNDQSTEMEKAIQKVVSCLKHPLPQQIEILLQILNHPAIPINKIAIPTMEGLHMILVDSVISCGADSNYTILLLKNKQKIIASRTLKEIEEMLEDYSVARVHPVIISRKISQNITDALATKITGVYRMGAGGSGNYSVFVGVLFKL